MEGEFLLLMNLYGEHSNRYRNKYLIKLFALNQWNDLFLALK